MKHVNEQPVYLIHTGDPEKAWDPADQSTWPKDEKTGQPIEGDWKNAVYRFWFDGDEHEIKPGERWATDRGRALFVQRKCRRRLEEQKRDPITGRAKVIVHEFAPALEIEMVAGTTKQAGAAIGIKVDGKPAKIQPEPDKVVEARMVATLPTEKVAIEEAAAEEAVVVKAESAGLDNLGLDELRTLAKAKGINVPARANAAVIRSRLKAAGV